MPREVPSPDGTPDLPELTGLPQLVAAAAAESPRRLAIVESGGRARTWAELDDEVGRLAAGLIDAGVVAGHRVALMMANRLEFVVTYLATLRVQGVSVPINPLATDGEVARILADSGARVLVAGPLALRAARGASAGADPAPLLVVVGEEPAAGERAFDDVRADEPRWLPEPTDPDRLAALLYTSGTSGRPRAAMLSHRALAANVAQVGSVEPPMIHGDDVVLGILPLFHVYGLNAVLGGVLRHRAKLVLADRFDPEGTLDLIDDEACSVVPVAPPVFAHWRDRDLEGRLGPVRMMLSGSAPLDPEMVTEFSARTGVPVHQGYGLTEAAPVVTSTLRSQRIKPGSVGRALAGIEIRLVDDDGRVVEGDDPGELQIRGANLFSGYWPDGADGPGPDGWWSTGDVGFLDADGDVFLVDRRKDLVIVSGFNVYPTEIEDVVREVEGVSDVAVIGAPDPVTGEAVVAYVIGPPGIEDAVRRHCEQRLARFKQPSRVEVVAQLPQTITGKVAKGRLRMAERRRATGLLE